MEPTHNPRVLKWSLIIGIVIVLNLFFNYTLSLIYPSPKYDSYCPTDQVVNPPETQSQCVAVGGQWTETVNPSDQPIPVASKTKPVTSVQGYCNPTYTCQKNYDQAFDVYSRNVFIVLIALGIISIALGVFARSTDVVSIGLSFGGVISLIIASGRYWSQAQNILKVVILALALIVLIWLGMKKFKN